MTIEEVELEAFRQIRHKLADDFIDKFAGGKGLSNDEIAGFVEGVVNLESEIYSKLEKEINKN